MTRPPKIATWLLDHLTSQKNNDALSGDLLEEFGSGRSASWYWRQVLLAILIGLGKKLRAVSFALAFAIAWTFAVRLYWGRIVDYVLFPDLLSSVPYTSTRLPWPWSLVYEVAVIAPLSTIPIAVGLGQYLLLSKRFGLVGFSRGIVIASCLQIVFCTWGRYTVWHERSLAIAISFAILVLSMWAARKRKNLEARQASIVE